ncbi:hypothetical protein XI25_04705 [Paenibacillus sp. DMB20]|nr:hypothetical protein XI25_04705 [Paenibacillus sp. DMB20]
MDDDSKKSGKSKIKHKRWDSGQGAEELFEEGRVIDQGGMLESLEEHWRTRLLSVKVPEPSREDSIALIDSVKNLGAQEREVLPFNVIETLKAETMFHPQAEYPKLPDETIGQKFLNLVISQWNVYGTRSWGATGAAIAAAGFIALKAQNDKYNALFIWIIGLTVTVLAAVIYAFRSRDEGTVILQKLGKYSMMEQTMARLVLVTIFQIFAALPLSYILFRQGAEVSLADFLLGWSVPVISAAVICFVCIQWFGQWGNAIILFGTAGLLIVSPENARLNFMDMISQPQTESFYAVRGIMLSAAALLMLIHLIRWRNGGKEVA